MRSAALAPLNSIVSVPNRPRTVSLPSPGSQTNVSSPAPRSARSSPLFPSIESFPKPPSSSSVPEPPARLSLPSPPSSVVGMLSVKAPLASSIRRASSPARASTAIRVDALAPDLELGRPSSPKSTWRMPGSPALRRRAILSPAPVPLTFSDAALGFRVLLEGRRGLTLLRRDEPGRACDDGAPRRTNCLMSRAVIHVDASPL